MCKERSMSGMVHICGLGALRGDAYAAAENVLQFVGV